MSKVFSTSEYLRKYEKIVTDTQYNLTVRTFALLVDKIDLDLSKYIYSCACYNINHKIYELQYWSLYFLSEHQMSTTQFRAITLPTKEDYNTSNKLSRFNLLYRFLRQCERDVKNRCFHQILNFYRVILNKCMENCHSVSVCRHPNLYLSLFNLDNL